MMQRLFVFLLVCQTQTMAWSQSKDTGFLLEKGERWWGGAVSLGSRMPMGNELLSFNLYGDVSQNQSTPLLISSVGRWLWSEEPFRYQFSNDSLIVDQIKGRLLMGSNGRSLKEAYRYVSNRFFPTSGKWPDSLLVQSPQYNLWIELMYNPNQKDVLNYAHQVIAHHFPTGVLMIDDNWSNYYGAFDFNKEKFPDARKMIDQLHAMGFKVMVWICPFISPDSEAFRELASKKLLLLDDEGSKELSWVKAQKPLLINWWNGYSACLDLTNPGAKEWLQAKLDTLQKRYGVDGYKLDAGDAYFYNHPQLLAYKKVSANDHTTAWAEIGLRYPLNEYRAMWKMGGQPLVQRLSDKAHNWNDLRLLIPNTIAQQLEGYTFTCPDMIGGGEFTSFLAGKKIDQNMIVRSTQVHALMPMMQFSAAPWRILDSVHLAAVKKAVALRQRQLPLLMQVMREAAQTGEPALRPLEYDFPGQGYIEVKDQFMLGNSLMVAPVVTSSNVRKVVFPRGEWKYKNEIIKGPAERSFTVPLDELLYFANVQK